MTSQKLDISTGKRILSGIEYVDVSVGDIVTVTFETANTSKTVVKRVADVAVRVDENLQERLMYTLSETGVFITADYLSEIAVEDLTRRIREVEALV